MFEEQQEVSPAVSQLGADGRGAGDRGRQGVDEALAPDWPTLLLESKRRMVSALGPEEQKVG